MSEKETKKYDASSIISLSDRDAVRTRPATYIGDNGADGLFTIWREVFDNSKDEVGAGHGDEIDVTFNSDGSVTIRDYGRGIPPYVKKETNCPAEREAYTSLNTGGKFNNRDDNGLTFAGGSHGIGASAANFMSAYFDVLVWRDGIEYHDRFENGGEPVIALDKKTHELPQKPSTKKTGTQVTFLPDPSVMSATDFNFKRIEAYIKDIAYTNPRLTVHLVNRQADYDEMINEQGGISALVSNLLDADPESKPITSVQSFSGRYDLDDKRYAEADISLAWTNGSGIKTVAFTNGIRNKLGGTHVDGLLLGISRLVNTYAKELKLSDATIEARDLRPGLVAVVSFRDPNPAFSGQVKDVLASSYASSAVSSIVYHKGQLVFDRAAGDMEAVIKQALARADAREKANAVKTKLDTKDALGQVSKKLSKAKKLGQNAELFIVEGDSAGGTVIKMRDTKYQAVLPIRGKSINVLKNTIDKVLQNQEIATLFTAIGAGVGSTFNVKKMNYGKIIIASDADEDGGSIASLIVAIFYKLAPEVIKGGHLYRVITPLYVNTLKDKKIIYSYSEKEQVVNAKKYRAQIKDIARLKGLGEAEPEEIDDTVVNPATRHLVQYLPKDWDKFESILNDLLGSDVEPRKEIFFNPERYLLGNNDNATESGPLEEIFPREYTSYAIEVITDRAIPDALDGLKPVQRRIIYDMGVLNHLTATSKTVKTARISGDIIAKLHAHGNVGVEDAIAKLNQDWSNQLPLVNGKGNWGDVLGHSAAAARYTETRPSQWGDALLTNLKEGVVPYKDNYDGTLKEPVVLPAQLPLLLINGTSGIAVGMATDVPPHNPREVIKAVIAILKKPTSTLSEIMKIMPGPDFPTGGQIINPEVLTEFYKTGNAKGLKVRGKLERGKNKLIVREIPYSMSGHLSDLVANITDRYLQPHVLPGVTDVSDYTNKNGIEVVISTKSGTDLPKMEARLFAKTRLEDTVKLNFVAIDNGIPTLFGLKDYLNRYIKFQHTLVVNEYTEKVAVASNRLEIVQGLLKAQSMLDTVIDVVRSSSSKNAMKHILMSGKLGNLKLALKKHEVQAKKFDFTERQADAILSTPLYRLSKLDEADLKKEEKGLITEIENAHDLIKSPIKQRNLIIKRHEGWLKKFSGHEFDRKTVIKKVNKTDFSADPEDVETYTALVNKFGYFKLVSQQKSHLDDYVYQQDQTSDDALGVFTSTGALHLIWLDTISKATVKDKGQLLDVLASFDNGEHTVSDPLSYQVLTSRQLVQVSSDGDGKIVSGKEFAVKTKRKRLDATKLIGNAELIFSKIVPANCDRLLLVANTGAIKVLKLGDLKAMGKATKGNQLVKLHDDEHLTEVIAFDSKDDKTSLSINSHDYQLVQFKVGKLTQILKPASDLIK